MLIQFLLTTMIIIIEMRTVSWHLFLCCKLHLVSMAQWVAIESSSLRCNKIAEVFISHMLKRFLNVKNFNKTPIEG